MYRTFRRFSDTPPRESQLIIRTHVVVHDVCDGARFPRVRSAMRHSGCKITCSLCRRRLPIIQHQDLRHRAPLSAGTVVRCKTAWPLDFHHAERIWFVNCIRTDLRRRCASSSYHNTVARARVCVCTTAIILLTIWLPNRINLFYYTTTTPIRPRCTRFGTRFRRILPFELERAHYEIPRRPPRNHHRPCV